MPSRTFLRPIRSPSRGRNSENTAQEVKNTVCVKPICASVVLSSTRIVVNAGDSIDAFSWKAKMAAISAAISATTDLPPASSILSLLVSVMIVLLVSSFPFSRWS